MTLDKRDYFDRFNHLLNAGPYICLAKNNLSQMISEVAKVFKKCHNFVIPNVRRKLVVSYPVISKLHSLHKIHKPDKTVSERGDAMPYNLSK